MRPAQQHNKHPNPFSNSGHFIKHDLKTGPTRRRDEKYFSLNDTIPPHEPRSAPILPNLHESCKKIPLPHHSPRILIFPNPQPSLKSSPHSFFQLNPTTQPTMPTLKSLLLLLPTILLLLLLSTVLEVSAKERFRVKFFTFQGRNCEKEQDGDGTSIKADRSEYTAECHPTRDEFDGFMYYWQEHHFRGQSGSMEFGEKGEWWS
ncbi:uncharacterized protein MYCFIDRAFT_177915 [Pseudocercospora fijiensis CIRAD86]|uniref:Uncharacterized protein n=1 Tax=Pseudocercospora fijiensis (strain CIRAD86) TaxID=383855 RepID=M3APE6_PSEFD|nr:uncharacterized protein MYCFIDRAFT_177915 [Pseudocercospora fijiensis CIRAD86]EME79292.1 hypothetical protein MYCFIDRAFT_177915 [Pseudocercospora fijiensis CIRAD86]